MPHRLASLALLLLVALAPLAPAATRDDAIDASRDALAAYMRDASIPALQVAVWKDGEIAWSEALGEANVETHTPATTTTKFRIASISKSLTGTLLAMLVAEGRIDLDRPIGETIVDYPDPGAAITPRQLASHTAGIRHYRGSEIGSLVHYPSLRAALVIFAADDLLFEPGEKYDYSTYGYTVLGAVMEAATDETFFDLLDEEVLTPLGMIHTVVDERAAIIPERASAYEVLEGGIVVNARPTDHSYKIPGGGLLSTAEDLVRFGAAHMKPGELDEATLELLYTPSMTNDGSEIGYSLGWFVRPTGDGPPRLSHTGSQPGSTCALTIRPDQGIVVAVLTNARGVPRISQTANAIADRFASEP